MTKAKNPVSHPIDHLARRGAADAPALLIGERVMTYAELDAGVGLLAAWLREEIGGPGERVASWSAKTRLACLMPLAAARAGLIHVPINPLLKGPQAEHILSDSGAKLLVTNAARAEALGNGLPADCTLHDLKTAEEVVDLSGDLLPPSKADPDELAQRIGCGLSIRRPWAG